MRQLSQRGERQGLRQGCARRGELLKYPGLPGALQSCTDTGLQVEMVELLLLFFFFFPGQNRSPGWRCCKEAACGGSLGTQRCQNPEDLGSNTSNKLRDPVTLPGGAGALGVVVKEVGVQGGLGCEHHQQRRRRSQIPGLGRHPALHTPTGRHWGQRDSANSSPAHL